MEENKLDIRKAFEAIAKIIGNRENVEIQVKEIRRKEEERSA
ncbi:hypothetical protein [Lachnoclostridium sp. An14]|nr:hypothetical protein [Lachnoclostridium sp. An14]